MQGIEPVIDVPRDVSQIRDRVRLSRAEKTHVRRVVCIVMPRDDAAAAAASASLRIVECVRCSNLVADRSCEIV